MRKAIVTALVLGMMVCGSAAAQEGQQQPPTGPGAPMQGMGRGMMGQKPSMSAGGMQHHQQKHEMMVEEQTVMLETIQLIKEVAKDKDTKAKAEALEKRMQRLIKRHQGMYAEMMQMMQEGGKGMGPMMHHGPMMGNPPAQPPAKQ